MSIPQSVWNCECVGVCCSSFHNSKDECRNSELDTNVVLLMQKTVISSALGDVTTYSLLLRDQ